MREQLSAELLSLCSVRVYSVHNNLLSIVFFFSSTIHQSKEMEEEQAYTCSGIDDGDDAVGDYDDDDETFHMDDGMQLIIHAFV